MSSYRYPLYIICCLHVRDIVLFLDCCENEIIIMKRFGQVDCSGFVLRVTVTKIYSLYLASYPTNYQLLVSTALVEFVMIAPKERTPTLSQPLKESQLFLCVNRPQWICSTKLLLEKQQVLYSTPLNYQVWS